jgi:chorismate-pyruvate lyase
VNLIYPLDEFYRLAGREALPSVIQVAGEEVPEPFRRLLVHESDMTPTLEAYHGERIGLRVLTKRIENGALFRQVLLVRESDGRPVEYGAIAIHLDRFPPRAVAQILEGRVPLGTILHSLEISHRSRPRAFIRITVDEVLGDALGLSPPRSLYGRRNVLRDPAGIELADIVEILPP